MKTKKLKNTLIKYFIGFTVLLLAIIYLFQIVLLNDFYKMIRTQEVKTVVNNVMNDESIATNNMDICIIIIENNVVKANSFRCNDPQSIQKEVNSVYQNVLENDLYEKIKNDVGKQNEQLVYGKKVSINKAIIAITPLLPIDATTSTLKVQLAWIFAVSIGLIFLLVVFLNKKIVKPLLSVKEDADKIAHGNYNIEKKELGYQEVNELSATLAHTGKELSKVDKLQMELISNITHDLKTPLTLISGYAQLMLDIPKENNRENAEIILKESNRLTSLVTDILEIAKIKSNSDNLVLENCDVYQICEEVVQSVSTLVKKDGYEIELTGANLLLNVDKYKVKQAVYNLVVNAIQYTGEDKKVERQLKCLQFF